MSGLRNRGGSSKRIEAETLYDQYRPHSAEYEPTWTKTFLWAPFDVKPTNAAAILTWIVLQMAAMMIWVIVVGLVKSRIVNTALGDINAALVLGAVSAASFYALTGWRSRTRANWNQLPLHLGWNTTLPSVIVFRTGLIVALGYMALQLVGAFFGALVLNAALGGNPNVLPPDALTGNSWGFELLGSIAISLTLIYNNYVAATVAEEDEHRRDSEMLAAMVRFAVTVAFLQFGTYTFEPMLYFGAYASQCIALGSCPAAQPFAFYALYTLIGSVVAAGVYIVVLVLHTFLAKELPQNDTIRRSRARGAAAPESSEAELAQPLLTTPFNGR